MDTQCLEPNALSPKTQLGSRNGITTWWYYQETFHESMNIFMV